MFPVVILTPLERLVYRVQQQSLLAVVVSLLEIRATFLEIFLLRVDLGCCDIRYLAGSWYDTVGSLHHCMFLQCRYACIKVR